MDGGNLPTTPVVIKLCKTLYYSSFHLLFHYPDIILIYCSRQSSLWYCKLLSSPRFSGHGVFHVSSAHLPPNKSCARQSFSLIQRQ